MRDSYLWHFMGMGNSWRHWPSSKVLNIFPHYLWAGAGSLRPQTTPESAGEQTITKTGAELGAAASGFHLMIVQTRRV